MSDLLAILSQGAASLAAQRAGMRPLRDSGIQKVFAGLTTIEEVVRETLAERDPARREELLVEAHAALVEGQDIEAVRVGAGGLQPAPAASISSTTAGWAAC